ncbi:MAG: carboxynorspermidine decarboxylase [Planctomycetota bacterium]
MMINGDMIDPVIDSAPSPCFIVDADALHANVRVLNTVQRETGAKVLLALKGFAMFSVFPILNKTLAGVCASSVDEARLGCDLFGGQVHTFSPAYSPDQFSDILALSDHIIFNSLSQWERYKPQCLDAATTRNIEFGLRINPERSETETPLYDPCIPGSRLGILARDLDSADLTGISGLHFHTLCERDSYALERTLAAVEAKFSKHFGKLKWVNFGGGHHITKPGYDVAHLCEMINSFRARYGGINVYLEPGEAVALNAGVYVATVLDIVHNALDIAILDGSASTHLPDVLEMPYRPTIIGASRPGDKPHTYRLGGNSCLAGDIIGDYSFDKPLAVGDRLVFTDMAHYTMVKTTTFNGVRLPTIALYKNGAIEIVRRFGYEDYKNRLS